MRQWGKVIKNRHECPYTKEPAMISSTATIAIALTFGAFMMTTSAVRRKAPGLDIFLVADRNVSAWEGAFSVASTWIWAPALFIAAQKAYQQGAAGLFWFTAPNVGCLILFAFVAPRIRNLFPKGYTFPQYISMRFDKKTHLLYLFNFFSLQVCSLAVQLIAGGALLSGFGGIPYPVAVLMLALIFTSYSLIDGLKTSIRTDLFQMVIIFGGILLLVPCAILRSGGLHTLSSGLSGVTGQFGNIFDPGVAYTFGITVTIGLFSGPFGDQQHWQRVFGFREGAVKKGYLMGAALFAIVPLSLGLLGFIGGAMPEAAPMVRAGVYNAQMVGMEVVHQLLPGWGGMVFLVMVICGLASTGDSALCAGGSLVAVDVYHRYIRPGADEKKLLQISRGAILAISILAVIIAFIPGITILALFLFYGTLRSSTFMPTLYLVFRKEVSSEGIFFGVLFAIAAGLPMYIAGETLSNVHLKVGANIFIIVVSFFVPFFMDKYGAKFLMKTKRI